MTRFARKLRRALSARSVLSRRGVLGMNRRNIEYIGRYNSRRLYPLVDNKLKTKQLAQAAGLNVPDLLAVIAEQHHVQEFESLLAAGFGYQDWSDQGFCIKPAKGSGGKGILVIVRRDGERYIKSNGEALGLADIERHLSNVLAGLFSLGGAADVALVEGLIEFDSCFTGYSYEGVPDTRVIVFKGYPVMAMTRLSTRASQGKANLHQGAVGVGLDLATGRAIRAVQYDQPLRLHPDTGVDLLGLEVPHWDRLLHLAASCYDTCGLGYLGVDLVLDQCRGPMLLELNARPGLTIQVANDRGLLPLLRAVEALQQPAEVSERVAYAQQVLAKL